MRTIEQLLDLADFLGEDMTEKQAAQLMDEARLLSIADKERMLDKLNGSALYTEMSMHNAEMGGFYHYN